MRQKRVPIVFTSAERQLQLVKPLHLSQFILIFAKTNQHDERRH